MASKWVLGDFRNGTIMRDILPVSDGGDVSVDINGAGSATIEVNLEHMSRADRKNWAGIFAPTRRFIALVDEDRAWNDPHAILFGGFINRADASVAQGYVSVQALELNEYLKARLVIDTWASKVEDPEASRVFEGVGYAGLIANVVERAFSASGVPGDAPKPPQILGDIVTSGTSETETRKKIVALADAMTYAEVLQEIKEVDSPDGREWVFRPRFTDEFKTRIVWDLYPGTAANPHWREKQSIEIPLGSVSHAKFSEYSLSLDGTDLYTSIYSQSRAGELDEAGEVVTAADLTGKYVNDPNAVLFETFFSPGVELTEAQMTSQLAARTRHAGNATKEITTTFEEEVSPAERLKDLGKVIRFTETEEDESLGYEAEVRLVGVSWRTGTNSVKLEVMSIQPVYPKLPSQRRREVGNQKTGPRGIGKGSFGGGGIPGGGMPGGNPWDGPGAGIPTGAGPGGGFGSGGMGSKTDMGPYKIGSQSEYPAIFQYRTQTIGNIVFGFDNNTNSVVYRWDEQDRVVASVGNAATKEGGLALGSLYLDNGTHGGKDTRFFLDNDLIVQQILTNRSAYKLDPIPVIHPGEPAGVSYVGIAAAPVAIRDNLYLAMYVVVEEAFKPTPDYTGTLPTRRFSAMVFGRMQINAWNALNPLTLLPTASFRQGIPSGVNPVSGATPVVGRVGDWMMVKVDEGYYAANFGLTASVIEGDWLVAANSAVPTGAYQRPGYIAFTKMFGNPNNLAGGAEWHLILPAEPGRYRSLRGAQIPAIDTGQPIAKSQAAWELTEPTLPGDPDADKPGIVDNFGGYGVIFSASSNNGERYTRVYFQDEVGEWHLDPTVVNWEPVTNSLTYEDWLYGSNGAIQILRTPEWALEG